MSIIKPYHNEEYYRLECDECGERVESPSFSLAVQYKKDHCWRSIKLGFRMYKDLCPRCQRKEKLERGRSFYKNAE